MQKASERWQQCYRGRHDWRQKNRAGERVLFISSDKGLLVNYKKGVVRIAQINFDLSAKDLDFSNVVVIFFIFSTFFFL